MESETRGLNAKLPHAEFSLGLGIELSVVILVLCGIGEDERRLWPGKKTLVSYGWDILHVQDNGRADSAMDGMNLSVHYCLFQCPVQRTKDVTTRTVHANTATNVSMGEVEQNDVLRLFLVFPFSCPHIFSPLPRCAHLST